MPFRDLGIVLSVQEFAHPEKFFVQALQPGTAGVGHRFHGARRHADHGCVAAGIVAHWWMPRRIRIFYFPTATGQRLLLRRIAMLWRRRVLDS